MTLSTRVRRSTLARSALGLPAVFAMACHGGEAKTDDQTGSTKDAITAQLGVTLIEHGAFDPVGHVNDGDEGSGAWGPGPEAFVGYDLGASKRVQSVWTYGDKANGFSVQLFDADWRQTGWHDCPVDGGSVQWQGCDIPETDARFVYVRYHSDADGTWVQELDIYGDEAGGGGNGGNGGSGGGSSAGTNGIPEPPAGWVVDLDDDFNSIEWNNWKQQQRGVPLIHTPMYMNSDTNCVAAGGYLELRATKRADGSGVWDGCYLDQGSWWAEGADAPAHPGYADYQVSFKANLPPGWGTGMYFLMWPVARFQQEKPWPPELDIVELPNNTGDDVMTTWHWDTTNQQHSVFPQVDRTGDKEWVYTARRVGSDHRMWIGNPSTNEIREIPLPAEFSNDPDYRRMLVGMANFVGTTWALQGDASAGWYGDANATDATSWTARVDYVKVWKPGPGMGGQ